MFYNQVVFALMFDCAIWGVLPGSWSIFGGSIVIVSTLWVALKTQTTKVAASKEPTVDEETALLGSPHKALKNDELVLVLPPRTRGRREAR